MPESCSHREADTGLVEFGWDEAVACSRRVPCRLCGSADLLEVVDLGASPPCERLLTVDQLGDPEVTYPLCLRVCTQCWLAQIPPLIDPHDTFVEYAYFSSCSTSWVEHARKFVGLAAEKLGLNQESFVIEVASNDGYLLQHVMERGIRCLGIEPSANVGQAARDISVPTVTEFLDQDTARAVRSKHGPADLVVANNVYAHVPDLLGFTTALRTLVAEDGWISIEVQHLLTLIEQSQYDTIYHEHFQYFTVASARRALATGGLTVVDVELLPTHGGSIRLWARPAESGAVPSRSVTDVLALEKDAGLDERCGYADFAGRVSRIRRDLLAFLLTAARNGSSVVGYGAPGKGNTLLNHCGVRPDLLPYTVDRNTYKQGRFTPGARIPVLPPERIVEDRPDFVLVLPWNLRSELTQQLSYIAGWGGKLVFPIPHLEVVEV